MQLRKLIGVLERGVLGSGIGVVLYFAERRLRRMQSPRPVRKPLRRIRVAGRRAG